MSKYNIKILNNKQRNRIFTNRKKRQKILKKCRAPTCTVIRKILSEKQHVRY